jgi:SWI/SNF-related matrix-associated actin-dependent regulator 1 of chromatin subfamily A
MENHWEEIASSIEGHAKIPADGHLSTLRRDLAETKVEAAVEFVSNLLEQGESIVVFCHHREVVRRITESLSRSYSVGSVFGDTPIANRELLISAFQAGSAQCLICSIRAAGVGLNLQKSHIAVFVEEDWSPSAMAQAKARIRRIGQKSFCLYYYLLYPESIDMKVHEVVERKAKDISKFWDVNVKPEEEVNWDEKEDAGSDIDRPSGL